MYRIDGGTDQLANALAKDAGRIDLRHAVRAVQQDTRTVTVTDRSSDDEIAAAELFLEMKREAMARSAPDPRADPRWTHDCLAIPLGLRPIQSCNSLCECLPYDRRPH